MRKKLISGMTAVAMMALAACAFAGDAPTIKIGEINSYSNAPQFAGPYRNGWQLALEEINAAGGVNGHSMEVIARDDAGKQDVAVRLARHLLMVEKVDLLAGAYMSNIGLAIAAEAAHHKKLFVATEALSDALVWDKGNRYTFRLRPSTYMQAAMLVDEAVKIPGRRWAILAPNYEYGQSAAASFKLLLKAKRRDVEFVGEQWPAMGKLDAEAVVQALRQAQPDAIFNATFGADLAKFVQEGTRRGLFPKVQVISMLSGEPENLDMLTDEAPKGWLVTGYLWNQINTPEHNKFLEAYQKKYGDYPRLGSVVGYTLIYSIAEAVKKAGSTETEKLVAAMRGLSVPSPFGLICFRAIDQQSTMGAFVGSLEQKGGKSIMSNWHYEDGKKYLPGDAYVMTRRPAAAMK